MAKTNNKMEYEKVREIVERELNCINKSRETDFTCKCKNCKYVVSLEEEEKVCNVILDILDIIK